MSRATLLVVVALSAGACRRERDWRCEPLGTGALCVESRALDLPLAPWQCHEARGHLLCATDAGAPAPAAPWRCRRSGRWHVCVRPQQRFPDAKGAAAWRCVLRGDGSRACRTRAWGNDAFRCDAGVCGRRYPDYPSDGEWDCYAPDGRIVCRSEMLLPTDETWRCRTVERERTFLLCVDPDPDEPAAPGPWDCRYPAAASPLHECRPTAVSCSADDDCDAGFCLGGRCTVAPLAADCFYQTECPPGLRCRGGTCVSGAAAR